MNLKQLESGLQPFLPPGAAALYCSQIIGIKGINFKLSRERSSKHGDYRHKFRQWRHQISININLSPYHFLVTLLHETAHLLVHERFDYHGEPHGVRWQAAFAELIAPWLVSGLLPDRLRLVLKAHVASGFATTTGDPRLLGVLRELEGVAQDITTLESLPQGAVFGLQGQMFRKGEKLRTFYKCYSLTNEREYRVRATAEVDLVSKSF